GTALVSTLGALQLLKDGTFHSVLAEQITAAAMDDAATVIVFQSSFAAPRRLFGMSLATRGQWPLAPDASDSFQPVLTADGRSVLYLSASGDAPPQVFFGPVDGTSVRQLTTLRGGVTEATVSADGRTVFAIGGNGSILRIDAASGSATTLVGPTPR